MLRYAQASAQRGFMKHSTKCGVLEHCRSPSGCPCLQTRLVMLGHGAQLMATEAKRVRFTGHLVHPAVDAS